MTNVRGDGIIYDGDETRGTCRDLPSVTLIISNNIFCYSIKTKYSNHQNGGGRVGSEVLKNLFGFLSGGGGCMRNTAAIHYNKLFIK